MSRGEDSGRGGLDQEVLEGAFLLEMHGRGCAADELEQLRPQGGTAEVPGGDPENGHQVTCGRETARCPVGDVGEEPDHPDHRRGVDGTGGTPIVKAHVAPGHRDVEGTARVPDAPARLPELEEHIRLFRAPEVQAVGDPQGDRAGAGHVARGLGHGGLPSLVGVQAHVAVVAVHADGQTKRGTRHADHPGVTARAERGVGLHGAVVLLPDPPLAGQARGVEKLLEGFDDAG